MTRLELRPAMLARWFGLSHSELVIENGRLHLKTGAGEVATELAKLRGLRFAHRTLWSDVYVDLRDGRSHVVTFVTWLSVVRFRWHLWSVWTLARIREANRAFDHPEGRDQFMTRWMMESWLQDYGTLRAEIDLARWTHRLTEDDRREIGRFVQRFAGGEAARAERNTSWMQSQKQRHAGLFNSKLGYALNEQQVDAIVQDDHRMLVVAGAGTGKTSTIVGKVAWLFEQDLATDEEIVIVAFNKSAAAELKARILEKTGRKPRIQTFHAYGNAILARAQNVKKTLSRLAEDEGELEKFLEGLLRAGLNNPDRHGRVLTFLAYFKIPDPTPVPREGSHEAHRYAKNVGMTSLTGKLMKSASEVAIANWLTLHGIQWEYERPYPVATATVDFQQYKPDFYLPDYDLYVEHWASEYVSNLLPEEWDHDTQARYIDGMLWKRNLHRKHGTTLIESYHHPDGRRAMLEVLRAKLLERGVKVQPLSDVARNQLVATLTKDVSDVTTLVQSFLALYREGPRQQALLRARAEEMKDERALVFFEMFSWVLAEYEKELAREDAIDFSDMIRGAAQAVQDRTVTESLRYLMVDEFQDTSVGKADLLRALLDANPTCRLFAVGDDWQSIYRFAGSDVSVMVRFQDFFGDAQRVDLRQTHRFGSNLLEVSSRFVQTNPRQLKKQLLSARMDREPMVEILGVPIPNDDATSGVANALHHAPAAVGALADGDGGLAGAGMVADGVSRAQAAFEANVQLLGEAYRRIAAEKPQGVDVLVVGRYRFLEDVFKQTPVPYPTFKARFSTVHRAKGAEADYVVILSVTSGRTGFPSEIADDPLLAFVLAEDEGYANAEERRLFYVALSRARYKAYVITDAGRISAFVEELWRAQYSDLVMPSFRDVKAPTCNKCQGGPMRSVSGPHGEFVSCTHYPLCDGKCVVCPRCGKSGLQPDKGAFACFHCESPVAKCPKCKVGYLKRFPPGTSKKTGKSYLEFWGCSTYRTGVPGACSYRQDWNPNY